MTHAATLERHDHAARGIAAPARAHLVGVAGAGMRALADVLHAGGWQISGSDLAETPGAAFPVRRGHDADAVDPSLELVVYSNAVPRENPELRRARRLGIPTLSYPRMLGRLMQSRRSVAIAGTHGKSTAAAMVGEILAAAGLDPTVVVGAAPLGRDSGGRHGRGGWMVAEACEYRAGFHHLEPDIAAILNIEPDHFDCFDSPAELEDAFAQFVRAVPRDGLLLAHAECEATQRVCAELACRTETFGCTPAATWQAGGLRGRRGYYSFAIRHQDRAVCRVTLQVPGCHNVANALAAAAVASHCGANGAAIQAGLNRFAGLRRRLQLLGQIRGVALVDDYAHHPTEVAATLAALREVFPRRRLWCVFQPHQVSRLERLLDEFAVSLQNADRIIVADVFPAREPVPRAGHVSSRQLRAQLARRDAAVAHLASADEIRDHLARSLRPGDVLVTMGAGDIGRVAHELGQGF